MIITLILSAVIGIFATIANIFHLPVVTELPWGLDYYVGFVFGSARAFADIFPPMGVLYTAFTVYLTFRIVLFTLHQIRVFKR